MKHLRYILIALLSLISVATTEARREPGDKVGAKINNIVYDFGTVREDGERVIHQYEITNTGQSALAIIWVKPNCGCTAPEYPRKPLKPGEKANIKVTFNPVGQKGEVDKDIRVKFRNGAGKSEELSLRLTGVVIP